MSEEDEPISILELFLYWRDEAKLYAFSAETRIGALVLFLASSVVLVVLFLNPQWFGTAEDELKVRAIEFAIVLFFFPTLMAIDMFFRGGQAGIRLSRKLPAAQSAEKKTKQEIENKERLRAGLEKLHGLMMSGNHLVVRMKSAWRGPRNQHSERPNPLEFSGAAMEWEIDVKECMRTFCASADVARFEFIKGKESDWPNYSDIIDNGQKTVAATIEKRLEFLSEEILKKYGDAAQPLPIS